MTFYNAVVSRYEDILTYLKVFSIFTTLFTKGVIIVDTYMINKYICYCFDKP